MSSRNITWEIILAGLAFVAIGIYLLEQRENPPNRHRSSAQVHIPHPAPPKAPEAPLPSSIVIDLENMDELDEMEKLENMGNLKNLKIKLKDLDRLLEQRMETKTKRESLTQSLAQVKQELQQIGNSDFDVVLQDRKIFINKDYKVKEGSWTEVNPGVYVFREAFGDGSLRSVKFILAFGNINVIGSETEKTELILRATGDLEDPKFLQNQIKVSRSDGPQSASIQVSSESKNLSNHINLEATLRIPASLSVDASTRGGHIRANNIDGEHKLHTAGGHIMLTAVSGSTEAKTSGGHITCDQLSGRATLQTSGGHIRVTESHANLTATTGGGHIDLTEFSGQVEAKTKGGNISAEFEVVEGPISMTASAGNITLELPGSIAADIDAKGSRVELEDEFSFAGDRSTSHISGTINGGGVPISISCRYGNVTITQ